MFRCKKGQSLSEYALLVSIVAAVLAGMQLYAQRGLQAKMKSGIDSQLSRLGPLRQYEPYYYTYEMTSKRSHPGVNSGGFATHEQVTKETNEQITLSGTQTYLPWTEGDE